MSVDGRGLKEWNGASMDGMDPRRVSGDAEREEEVCEEIDRRESRDTGMAINNDAPPKEDSAVTFIRY